MANHTLTGEHVLREAWDPTQGAVKVTVDSEFAVALDAADGDSITTVPNNLTVTGVQEMDATSYKSLVLYTAPGAGEAKVEVSPTASGDVWVDLVTVTANALLVVKSAVTDFRAVRIRISTTGAAPHVVMHG